MMIAIFSSLMMIGVCNVYMLVVRSAFESYKSHRN